VYPFRGINLGRCKPGDITIKYLWIIFYTGVLVWSVIHPKDLFTWFLEVFPALIGALVLAITYRSFRLTPLVYTLILIHCIILMVGGHYTYAEVPLFDYLKDFLGTTRNDYDKVGHFAQGFVPAMIAREIVIRKQVIRGTAWQAFFIICCCLAISAFYELVEWWVAVATGTGADAFLATQGYVWDTQSDMATALGGAISALLLLSKWHNRELARIET
jgi:putative membrane protein